MEPASLDLRQRWRALSRRLGLTTFWQWWAGELVPLIPHRLRNAMARMRMRPVLAFEGDAAVLFVPELANSHLAYKEAARIPLTGDQDAVVTAGRAAIESLSPAAGTADPVEIVVALPANQVLRKTITLPAAVEDNLVQVLAYDLDRHTPFKPDEMRFDANIVARDPVKRELRVDWAAALKTVVDQSRRRAESWGAVVVAVTPDSPSGPPATGKALNLLPMAERPETAARRRWSVWAPVALIAVAALVATALPVWQKRGYAIALMQLASQGRVQADASNALREQLERLSGDYNFALSKKYAFPSALQSVEDVTKLLPDDTWLTQLELKSTVKGKDAKREILVRGESANAGRLISLFEESQLFGETAPRSPTTKIQPGPGEIFDLGAQLKPLPPPPPVQLAAAAGMEPPRPAASPVPAVPEAPPASAPPPKGDPPARAEVAAPARSVAVPGSAAPPPVEAMPLPGAATTKAAP
jgi:general secretion pathway protein L